TGSFSLAIGANGKALFTSTVSGTTPTSPVPLHQIDLATDAITTRPEFPVGVRQSTHLVRGADRSLVFGTQSNSTNGAIFTYDPAADTFPRQGGTGYFLHAAMSSVSPDGGLIALESGNRTLSILDRALNTLQILPAADAGSAWDPVRDVLYATDAVNAQVVAYDT